MASTLAVFGMPDAVTAGVGVRGTGLDTRLRHEVNLA
jgi:hypothetical protein